MRRDPIKRITNYETEDGRVFDTYDEARRWLTKKKVVETLKDFFQEYGTDNKITYETAVEKYTELQRAARGMSIKDYKKKTKQGHYDDDDDDDDDC